MIDYSYKVILENGTTLMCDWFYGDWNVDGELPEPYFENDYYSIYKKKETLGDVEQYYAFVILYKQQNLNIPNMIGHHVNDSFETILNSYVDMTMDKKSYGILTPYCLMLIRRTDKQELIPVKEFCVKYSYCKDFEELNTELKKDGYCFMTFTSNIVDDLTFKPKQ